MGFMSSSCSFTRFRIIEDIPKTLWPQIPSLLKKNAIVDIDDSRDLESHGWTCFDDMLNTTWDGATPRKGTLYVFSLRVDKRRIPPGVLKKHLTIAIQAELAKPENSGKKHLSKERKKELKERVLSELIGHFLPIPAEFNVIWDDRTVWFASTQGKMVNLFMMCFLETFGLNLEQLTPYTLAADMLDEEDMEMVDAFEATSFNRPEKRK
jgi:hypothetical protein